MKNWRWWQCHMALNFIFSSNAAIYIHKVAFRLVVRLCTVFLAHMIIHLIFWLIGKLRKPPTSMRVSVKLTKIAWSLSLCTHIVNMLFPVWAGFKHEKSNNQKINIVWFFLLFDLIFSVWNGSRPELIEHLLLLMYRGTDTERGAYSGSEMSE